MVFFFFFFSFFWLAAKKLIENTVSSTMISNFIPKFHSISMC